MDTPSSFQPGLTEAMGWVFGLPVPLRRRIFFVPSANINKTCQGTSSPGLPESRTRHTWSMQSAFPTSPHGRRKLSKYRQKPLYKLRTGRR